MVAVYHLSGKKIGLVLKGFVQPRSTKSDSAPVLLFSNHLHYLHLSPFNCFILLCFALPSMAHHPSTRCVFFQFRQQEQRNSKAKGKTRERKTPQTSLFFPVTGSAGLAFMLCFKMQPAGWRECWRATITSLPVKLFFWYTMPIWPT